MTTATDPTHKPLGRSIVACEAVAPVQSPLMPADAKFYAVDPHSGRDLPVVYLAAAPADLDQACWKAWQAFHAMHERPGKDRAALLETIAARIADLGEDLLVAASDETGLGPARLVSERERTVNTLKMYAELVREGSWVEASIDTGQPSRRPVPKPDIRRMLRPVGPVAVFGAGNFPLAYSTAGGETAWARAAGGPVIVKGHPGHPGTGELVAQAVARAVTECDFDPGTFSFLHAGGQREMAIGQTLVKHPAVRAVGFTGSVAGGTALAQIAAERPDPIPVFAEMGSTNPIFCLPGALESQADAIAERLYNSATTANGQMCTCPGLIFVARSDGAEALARAMAKFMNEALPQTMLTRRTRKNFARRVGEIMGTPGVEVRAGSPQAAHRDASEPEDKPGFAVRCSPVLFKTTFEQFRRSPTLHEEAFGPAVLLVLCDRPEQLADAAACIQGSLTGTVWASATDEPLARRLQHILEQRVGRLIFNGVPTGVEVCPSMVHGGPYPATNQPHSTAVGPFAIHRWCRPLCYQNVPEAFLPPELRNTNPLNIRRLVNGQWTDAHLPTKP